MSRPLAVLAALMLTGCGRMTDTTDPAQALEPGVARRTEMATHGHAVRMVPGDSTYSLVIEAPAGVTFSGAEVSVQTTWYNVREDVEQGIGGAANLAYGPDGLIFGQRRRQDGGRYAGKGAMAALVEPGRVQVWGGVEPAYGQVENWRMVVWLDDAVIASFDVPPPMPRVISPVSECVRIGGDDYNTPIGQCAFSFGERGSIDSVAFVKVDAIPETEPIARRVR